jgi:CspA family cold shock protein
MAVGHVVRFDGSRGYGFIAPENGDEDVFLHVNELLFPESELRPGLAVEFQIQDGDRGPKASAIRLAADDPSAPSAVFPAAARQPDDDSLCDVLRAREFTTKVTELLLESAPSLTGDQILQVRRGLLRFARKHGWAED